MAEKEDVHGHIVPKRVLFTRTVQGTTEEYPSYAFSDNLKKLISITKVKHSDDETDIFYVTSNTKDSVNFHKTGTVLARIVHGNIPVKNGVVHLIDRPLMVVASSIMSYLREDNDHLMLFYELIRTHYSELTKKLAQEKADLTLFAPSNQAFEFVDVDRYKNIRDNKEKLGNLLNLHIVPQILTIDMIVNKSSELEQTLNNHHKLYFSINDSNPSKPIVFLDGAGVNATITKPNIPTKNGAIHIINRILGIPYQTVCEKLLTDPMLSSTANLSMQDEWNNFLDIRDKKFIFFAPSNDAWDSIKREMPSAHKKLFIGEFSYHVKHILQRHTRVGSNLNLDELAHLTNNATISGNIKHGTFFFQAKIKKNFGGSSNDTEYYVEWNGIQAKVIRPNVECINGVIHVIDQVLMMNSDVHSTVNASPASLTAGHIYTLCAIFITLIAAKI